jgi:hypothetical protein
MVAQSNLLLLFAGGRQKFRDFFTHYCSIITFKRKVLTSFLRIAEEVVNHNCLEYNILNQ